MPERLPCWRAVDRLMRRRASVLPSSAIQRQLRPEHPRRCRPPPARRVVSLWCPSEHAQRRLNPPERSPGSVKGSAQDLPPARARQLRPPPPPRRAACAAPTARPPCPSRAATGSSTPAATAPSTRRRLTADRGTAMPASPPSRRPAPSPPAPSRDPSADPPGHPGSIPARRQPRPTPAVLRPQTESLLLHALLPRAACAPRSAGGLVTPPPGLKVPDAPRLRHCLAPEPAFTAQGTPDGADLEPPFPVRPGSRCLA